VVASSLLFLGLGVALAWYCFSGGDKGKDDSGEVRPGPRPQVPVKKTEVVKPKPRPFLSANEQARVDQAIHSGVAYLRSTQAADGSWPGHSGYAVGPTALVGLTLLECGAAAQDAAVQKAVAWVRSRAKNLINTYELSLVLLFLDRLGEARDRPLIQELALRLVAGQLSTGGWTYSCPILPPKQHAQLLAVLTEIEPASLLDVKRVERSKLDSGRTGPVADSLKQLVVLQDPPGPEVKVLPGSSGDNSNTQFAILGLWAAGRHQVPLKRTMALMVKRFRTSQAADGSWSYYYPAGNRTTMSFAAAGLLGLAVGMGLTPEARQAGADARKDPAVQKALDWVSRQIGTPGESWPKLLMYDTLWLWSIERVAMLYNLRRIGGKEWYRWGAQVLIANQTANGAWPGTWATEGHVQVSTSMALLFLARANLARDITAKLGLED
jgi:hypothetical protein